MWYDWFIYVTWLIHPCDMTHSYIWYDSFICVAWLIYICDMTDSYVWNDWFIYVTWLIHIWDMTHLYVWHDSFIHVTWLIHICDMTYSCMWHDSFIYVTWLLLMSDRIQLHLVTAALCSTLQHRAPKQSRRDLSNLRRDTRIDACVLSQITQISPWLFGCSATHCIAAHCNTL